MCITNEIWIFSYKTHGFATGGLIHPPELCEARFITDARTLFDVFWTVEQKHPPTAMIEIRRARANFNATTIGFV